MRHSTTSPVLAIGMAALLLSVTACEQTTIGGPGPVANDRGEMSDPLRDEAVFGSEDFDNLPTGDLGDDDIVGF